MFRCRWGLAGAAVVVRKKEISCWCCFEDAHLKEIEKMEM